MKYFFISTTGSDSTGDGSALNPWATFDKAIGAGKAVGATLTAPTDLIVEPGLYREAHSIQVTPSAAFSLRIIGDCDGALFGAAGKANPKAGVVEIRAWTDDATPIALPALSVGTRHYVTIERLTLTGGSNAYGALSLHEATNFTARDCVFVGGHLSSPYTVRAMINAVNGLGLLIERCDFATVHASNGRAIEIGVAKSEAVYPINARIVACRFLGGSRQIALSAWNSGTGELRGTGLVVQNCSFTAASDWTVVCDEAALPAGAISVFGCAVIGCRRGFLAGLNQIVENGNVIVTETPRTNVVAGANSLVGVCPAITLGGEDRPYLEPLANSPLLGFGSYGTTPTLDRLGRPYADPPACGALERVDPVDPDPEPTAPIYIFQTEG